MRYLSGQFFQFIHRTIRGVRFWGGFTALCGFGILLWFTFVYAGDNDKRNTASPQASQSGDNDMNQRFNSALMADASASFLNSLGDTLMAIHDDGSVGIGAVNPVHKLTVDGDFGINGHIKANEADDGVFNIYSNTNASDGPTIQFFANAHPTRPGELTLIAGNGGETVKGIRFLNHNGTTWETNMVIRNDGNVGIGTNDPDANLDIIAGGGTDLRVGSTAATNLRITDFSTQLADVPGSTFGMQMVGPQSAHVVVDIQANDNSDGFYVRVPTTPTTSSVPDKTAFVVNAAGRVGIGTSTPQSELAVNGKITSREVQVTVSGWPDYVFDEDYKLLSIDKLEAKIKAHKHLPGIPSAKEVEETGVNLGEMQKKMMEKIEELTLYVIQQSRDIEALKKENQVLKAYLKRQ